MNWLKFRTPLLIALSLMNWKNLENKVKADESLLFLLEKLVHEMGHEVSHRNSENKV